MVENLLIPAITVDQATGGSGTMADGSADGVTPNRRVNSCLEWMLSTGGDPLHTRVFLYKIAIMVWQSTGGKHGGKQGSKRTGKRGGKQ
jgi:hypothetical protein